MNIEPPYTAWGKITFIDLKSTESTHFQYNEWCYAPLKLIYDQSMMWLSSFLRDIIKVNYIYLIYFYIHSSTVKFWDICN